MGSIPASVMTTPPQEWPTRITGPVCGQARGRRGEVIGECGQRKLHRRDVVALGLQNRDDLGPARTIGEGAVDEDDVLHGLRGCRRRVRRSSENANTAAVNMRSSAELARQEALARLLTLVLNGCISALLGTVFALRISEIFLSIAVDFYDRFRKGLRSFLRQVVPDATADSPVQILPRKLFAHRNWVPDAARHSRHLPA